MISAEADDIRVRGVDGTLARVAAPADGTGLETIAEPGCFTVRTDLRRRGAFLGIRIGSFGVGARLAGTLEIDVPRDAHLEVRSAAGDIALRDVRGGATVKAASGDVSVKRSAGPMVLSVASGDVLVEAIEPIRLEARSVSGDIRARAPFLERVAVETVSGDVTLVGSLAPAEHVATTVSGDVDLAVSGDLALTFRTVSGVVTCDHPGHRGGDGRHRPLVIGDGTARFSVRTMSGDVKVRAAPAAPQRVERPDPMPVAADQVADAPQRDGPAIDLAVLEALARGEIDVAEAERRLAAASPGSSGGASVEDRDRE